MIWYNFFRHCHPNSLDPHHISNDCEYKMAETHIEIGFQDHNQWCKKVRQLYLRNRAYHRKIWIRGYIFRQNRLLQIQSNYDIDLGNLFRPNYHLKEILNFYYN